MYKKLFLILSLLLIATSGFFLFNNYIYRAKQGTTAQIEAYRGTLTGEYICLPQKDQKGPHTLECALGLKTDTGEYYALDFNLLSPKEVQLTSGDRFTASGMITPIELLSTDKWQKYQVQGIFSVTDTVKKL